MITKKYIIVVTVFDLSICHRSIRLTIHHSAVYVLNYVKKENNLEKKGKKKSVNRLFAHINFISPRQSKISFIETMYFCFDCRDYNL